MIRSTWIIMAEDNGLYKPLECYLETVHRHELISLGLPTTQIYEIRKIDDSELPIAKPVLLPLPRVPVYRPPNSTTGSHPPFLSSGSTESTSRSELSKEDTGGDRGSFLQTARGESESIANQQNVPQTSNNGAAGAWLAGVHVRVVQSLLDRVNNLLHRGHPSQSQPSTSKSSSSKAASSGTLRGSTSSGNSSNRVRKGQMKTDNSPDEDSEEERPDQETPRKSAQRDLTTGIEFACPYHKANPERPHPKRCERGSWKTISKLKYVSMTYCISVSLNEDLPTPGCQQEHLQRHHKVQANTISDEVLAKLCEKESLGKKGNLTLEDKWGAIYHVLFPEATVIPCPCRHSHEFEMRRLTDCRLWH